jgi:hypothetical protein
MLFMLVVVQTSPVKWLVFSPHDNLSLLKNIASLVFLYVSFNILIN